MYYHGSLVTLATTWLLADGAERMAIWKRIVDVLDEGEDVLRLVKTGRHRTHFAAVEGRIPPMVITVTMNPALDKTASVSRLLPGELNRLQAPRTDAGGKGVNVSKMVAVLGGNTLCTGFVGGAAGQELTQRMEAMGLAASFLPVAGETRTNLKIMDDTGALTELNEPGIAVTQADLTALLSHICALAKPADVVVLGGSLPQGAAPDTYLTFATALTEAGCRVIVDADGEAFRHALNAPPFLVKPNRFELLQHFNLPADTPDSALPRLCRQLLAKGIGWVVLSMGSEGAMFFSQDTALQAKALRLKVLSTVGAGDSMVGAMAHALDTGLSLPEAASLAMACSMGAVTTAGTNPPDLALVNTLQAQVELTEI